MAFESSATDLPDDIDPAQDVFRRTVFNGTNLTNAGPTVLISRATGVAGASADMAAFPTAIMRDLPCLDP